MKKFTDWLEENNLIETNLEETNLNETDLNEEKSEPSPAYDIRKIKDRIAEIDRALLAVKKSPLKTRNAPGGGKIVSRHHSPGSKDRLVSFLGKDKWGPKSFEHLFDRDKIEKVKKTSELDQEAKKLYDQLRNKEKELKEKLGKPTSENTSFAAYILFRERNAA